VSRGKKQLESAKEVLVQSQGGTTEGRKQRLASDDVIMEQTTALFVDEYETSLYIYIDLLISALDTLIEY